jgi:hypothetical protein
MTDYWEYIDNQSKNKRLSGHILNGPQILLLTCCTGHTIDES